MASTILCGLWWAAQLFYQYKYYQQIFPNVWNKIGLGKRLGFQTIRRDFVQTIFHYFYPLGKYVKTVYWARSLNRCNSFSWPWSSTIVFDHNVWACVCACVYAGEERWQYFRHFVQKFTWTKLIVFELINIVNL